MSFVVRILSILVVLFGGFSAYADPRPQEEVWAELASGSEDQATKQEEQLYFRLLFEPIASDDVLVPDRHLIRKIKFDSGMFGVFRPWTEIYSPRHDMVYCELAREARFGIVPAMVLREYKGQVGSAQAFIHDLTPGDLDLRFEDYFDERLYALDFITGFVDRHPENWARRPGARLLPSITILFMARDSKK